MITKIKEVIVDYLSNECDKTNQLSDLFAQVAHSMKCGFEAL